MNTTTCPTCGSDCTVLSGSSRGVLCPVCGIVGAMDGDEFVPVRVRAEVAAVALDAIAPLCRVRNPMAEMVGTAARVVRVADVA